MIKDSVEIFISYRRNDSYEVTDKIYRKLTQAFGSDAIFKDDYNIPFGVDFREYIDRRVCQCRVLLAVIGKGWIGSTKQGGTSHLENPADFVRIEVELALKNGIYIIPVLVDDADMPIFSQLPESLSDMVYRNGIKIRNDEFQADINKLVDGINNLLSQEYKTEDNEFIKQIHGFLIIIIEKKEGVLLFNFFLELNNNERKIIELNKLSTNYPLYIDTIEDSISNQIEKAEQILSNECQELSTSAYFHLRVDVFLPSELLNIPIEECRVFRNFIKSQTFLDKEYPIIIHSFERLSDLSLYNKLIQKSQGIESALNKSFTYISNISDKIYYLNDVSEYDQLDRISDDYWIFIWCNFCNINSSKLAYSYEMMLKMGIPINLFLMANECDSQEFPRNIIFDDYARRIDRLFGNRTSSRILFELQNILPEIIPSSTKFIKLMCDEPERLNQIRSAWLRSDFEN